MTKLLSDSAYLLESLPEIWFGLVVVSLGVYLLLDGFDFGLGILYAEADEAERQTMLAAFGPVWKANEVWLVLFGTVLFAGFPVVYANLLSRHYLLVFAILFALSLRGLGSKLREERDDEPWVRFWDACFVVGSATSPFLLGVFVASWVLGTPSALAAGPFVIGVTVVALTIVLGAAFLGVKTDGELRARVGRRGQLATAVYVGLFVLTAIVLYGRYPGLQSVLLSGSTVAVVAATVAFAVGNVVAIAHDRFRIALVSAAGIAGAFVVFVATLLYPQVDPAAGLTIADAVVSPLPLNMTTLVAAIFLPIIVGYFVFLYSLFSGPARPEESYS
ncbi:cytochrome d ubiquinol oxidase subunit II [Natrarchaeobaculum sulfurireducens]|uniref:Cytochrome bd-type quinol oxidase, subunit 2 n=1 Tax=Natrarchaeobaculum sulfurireducens TaxID=2044521 RepID=A0A346PT48_9EURY|nr:cytochrome d ubiquinol oxidase subunit II [Natrarchaeobaculum sulfurireducens]AXR77344.1 Cytochrome bd-type quinol oxidase, subunit 2 [Natrarchaeobaculum sulfurireducens]AXR82693.1 Cytochrome d ubiquinol oxidase subunit II [Natrarchaeobaculum sulfurireducens]